MFLVFALLSAVTTAFGTFLTRPLVTKFPIYQIIGPLFIMNALAMTPLIPIRNDWVPLNGKILWQLLLLGGLTALGAVFVFVIVKRSSASLSIVGASLSPAMVLIFSPLILKVQVQLFQCMIIGFLIFAVLYPIRNSVLGIRSFPTFMMILTQGINAGFVAILISVLTREQVGLSQILFIQQIIAGFCFLIYFWPKDLSLRSYPLLARRSIFMSMGWFFAIVAIDRGNALVVQSVLSTTSFIIVLIETVSYRKFPGRSIIISSLAIILCVISLSFF